MVYFCLCSVKVWGWVYERPPNLPVVSGCDTSTSALAYKNDSEGNNEATPRHYSKQKAHSRSGPALHSFDISGVLPYNLVTLGYNTAKLRHVDFAWEHCKGHW